MGSEKKNPSELHLLGRVTRILEKEEFTLAGLLYVQKILEREINKRRPLAWVDVEEKKLRSPAPATSPAGPFARQESGQ